MTQIITPLRPGLTAIAAVLALSATPVFAQSADTAAAQDAPVISAPPAAPAEAAAPATDAAATPVQSSVTTQNTAEPVQDAAPAAPMATQSPVVIHQPDAPAQAPVARTAVPKHVAPPTAPAATPAPVAKVADPASTPVAAPPVPVATPAAPAPVTFAKTSTTTSTTAHDDNREIELAGAGAIGLLALIGGAFALSRRKRDDEEVLAPAAVTTMPVEPVAPVAYETVDTAPVTVAPLAYESAAIEGAPTTELHKDFDLSRYGPNVQMAYRGPTEDNPSLSLRHRLKRARFMDQRARENGETVTIAEPTVAPERKPAAQTLIGARLKDGLRSLRPQQGGMRPAFG